MKFVLRSCLVAVLAAGFMTMTADTSQAQFGFDGGGFGNYAYPGLYGGFGFRPSPYSLGQVPVPPYFALHPPVYYSQPVARPYGYSPFAYPGFVRTPEVVAAPCEPISIDNPYVPSSATESEEIANDDTDDYAVVKPLVIENPYVLDSPTQVDSNEFASVEYIGD